MIVYESVTMPLWTTGEANLKKGSPHRQPSSEIGYKSRWHSSWKAWSPLVIPWAGWPYNVLTMAHPRVYINVYTDYTYIYICIYIYDQWTHDITLLFYSRCTNTPSLSKGLHHPEQLLSLLSSHVSEWTRVDHFWVVYKVHGAVNAHLRELFLTKPVHFVYVWSI